MLMENNREKKTHICNTEHFCEDTNGHRNCFECNKIIFDDRCRVCIESVKQRMEDSH